MALWLALFWGVLGAVGALRTLEAPVPSDQQHWLLATLLCFAAARLHCCLAPGRPGRARGHGEGPADEQEVRMGQTRRPLVGPPCPVVMVRGIPPALHLAVRGFA